MSFLFSAHVLISCSCFLGRTTHLPFPVPIFQLGPHMVARSCFLFLFFDEEHTWLLTFHVSIFWWGPHKVPCSYFLFVFSNRDRRWSIAPVSCSCFAVGTAYRVARSSFLFLCSGEDQPCSLSSILLCSMFWVNLDYWSFVDQVHRFVGGSTCILVSYFLVGTAHGGSLPFPIPLLLSRPLMVARSHFFFVLSNGDLSCLMDMDVVLRLHVMNIQG